MTDVRVPEQPFHWSPHPRRARAAVVLAVVTWLICLVAELLVVLVDVESVMGTGPVIFLCGLVTLGLGLRARHRWGITLGLANIGICILLVTLVNVYHWSPHSATRPLGFIGALFLAGTFPLLVIAWLRRPAVRQPWECSACGYALIGLHSHTCPECGAPFDPQRVAASTPAANPEPPA